MKKAEIFALVQKNNEGIREFVSLKQTLQSAWACFLKNWHCNSGSHSK